MPRITAVPVRFVNNASDHGYPVTPILGISVAAQKLSDQAHYGPAILHHTHQVTLIVRV